MEWNVYCELSDKIKTYNIFDHVRFGKDVKMFLSESKTKEDFEEKLQMSLRYCFARRAEYELFISSMFSSSDEKMTKVGIYEQVMLNWKAFLDYVWSFHTNA